MSSLPQTTPRPRTDDGTFEQVYQRYNRLVFSRFQRHGFDKEETRDLLHRTFLLAFRGWPSFRGDSTPKTWLLSIADRVALNVFRDRGRLKNKAYLVSIEGSADSETQRPMAETLEAPAEESCPLERLIAEEKERMLWRALEDLPPQMRQITVLRLKNEFKYQQIADCLQISLNTVRSQLHEARLRLRDALSKAYDVEGLS